MSNMVDGIKMFAELFSNLEKSQALALNRAQLRTPEALKAAELKDEMKKRYQGVIEPEFFEKGEQLWLFPQMN